MTLGARLDKLRAARSSRKALHAPYEATIRELARTGFLDSALHTGHSFPDFLMPNAEGRLISSHEVLAKGPMVVSFFRGDWCPYCRVMLDSLQENLPGIVAQGG